MRIRTIKPEFWTHETLSSLPEATHMLAAALLNYCDDEGFFNANVALIKAACFPLREPSVSIHGSLTRLCEVGFISLGVGADGRRYGQVVKFQEHQRVNRPTPSKISGLQISWESSVRTHAQLTEDSPLERKGKEQGSGKERNGASAPLPSFSNTVMPDLETWLLRIQPADEWETEYWSQVWRREAKAGWMMRTGRKIVDWCIHQDSFVGYFRSARDERNAKMAQVESETIPPEEVQRRSEEARARQAAVEKEVQDELRKSLMTPRE